MRSILILSMLLCACGDDGGGEEAFPTLQACFDDHTAGGEALPVTQAITVCCIDHPIAGVHPSCGATAAECTTLVRAALSAATTMADISTACTDYQNQLGM